MSQEKPKSLEVEYHIKLMYNPAAKSGEKSDNNSSLFHRIEKMKTVLPFFKFDFEANRNSARFQVQDYMERSNTRVNLYTTLVYADAQGIFYTNTNKEINLRKRKLGPKNFLVTKNTKYDWKITGEPKIIAGYKCLKATADVYLNPQYKKEVQAWFCPQLSFSFGPKGYSGLPGLILGLEVNGFYFYANDVEVKEKDTRIEKPNGKIISQKKWEKVMNNYYSH
jgi:GLPGLI family protein